MLEYHLKIGFRLTVEYLRLDFYYRITSTFYDELAERFRLRPVVFENNFTLI